MEEKKSWKGICIVACLAIGLVASLSVTNFMSMSILLSNIQKIYLCAYFFAVFIGMMLYSAKKTSGRINTRKLLLIGVISCTVFFLCKDRIVPYADADIVVTATGQKNNAAVSYEAWILEIEENGLLIDASKEDVGKEGWYQQGSCLISNKGMEPASIVLHFDKMENAKITMLKHPWSGIVEILYRGTKEQVDLYSEIVGGERVVFEFTGVKEQLTADGRIILYIGLLLAVSITLLFIFSLLNEGTDKGRGFWVIAGLLIFLAANCGELNGFLRQHTKIIMLLIIAVSSYAFQTMKEDEGMKAYFSRKAGALLVLCDFYLTFAIVGHYLFISTNKVTVNIEKIVCFLACAVIFYPALLFAVYVMKKAGGLCSREAERTGKMVKKLGVCSFFMMLIPLIFFSLGYYPANMTSDGVDQWAQALGITPIYNAHPAIHTIFLRLCSKIAATPYSVVIIQIICFSAVWARLFAYLYKKGLNKKIIYIAAAFLACAPNDFIMLSLVSKNIIYAVIILWVTYLLMRMVDDPNNFFSIWRIMEFGVALALLYTVRKNGFLAAYSVCIVLFAYTICRWKALKVRPALVIATAFILIRFIQGPLYDYYGVPGSDGTVGSRTEGKVTTLPLINPIGTYILAGEELPGRVKEYAGQIGTEEEWKKGFNPYNGDILGWGLLRNRRAMTPISFKDAFKNYITMLLDKPLLVIKDRLNAVDILWNVIEPSRSYAMSNVSNGRYVVGLWPPAWAVERMPELLRKDISNKDGSCYFKPNIITSINSKMIRISTYQTMDSIFWRGGIYVVLGLLLVAVYIIERKATKIIALFPGVVTSISLALAFSCQIYQYYWFLFLAGIFNFLYCLKLETHRKQNEARKR